MFENKTFMTFAKQPRNSIDFELRYSSKVVVPIHFKIDGFKNLYLGAGRWAQNNATAPHCPSCVAFPNRERISTHCAFLLDVRKQIELSIPPFCKARRAYTPTRSLVPCCASTARQEEARALGAFEGRWGRRLVWSPARRAARRPGRGCAISRVCPVNPETAGGGKSAACLLLPWSGT